MRAWEHSKKPVENGKRERNRPTLAFLAMAVSRLERGTFPANSAGASRNGLSGLIIDKRTAGLEARPGGTDESKRTLSSHLHFPFAQKPDASAAGRSSSQGRIRPGGEIRFRMERRERKSKDVHNPNIIDCLSYAASRRTCCRPSDSRTASSGRNRRCGCSSGCSGRLR